MPYYIEGEAETGFLKIEKPEEIKLVDPAVGSGHMLTYAFDLLVKIYEEEGYAPSEIPEKILTHNLYGLEICPRAAQLAQFALVCKAREISRTAFRSPVQPQVICLQDINFEENELKEYIGALRLGDLFSQPVLKLMHQFEQATNFGSLIQPCLDEKAIADVRAAIEGKDLGSQLFLRETHRKVMQVLSQAEALTQRYHVVVANPPYMGGKGMNHDIKHFLQENFVKYKSDLFSAFIVRSLSLALSNGHLGFMSPFVWMFISSYEDLRKRLISHATITTLVQLEYSGFDGATVPICTFALQNKYHKGYRGGYVRLSDFRGSDKQGPKTLEAITNPNCGWFFRANAEEFNKIPGAPIAYWASPGMIAAFAEGEPFASLAEPRLGMATGSNERYVRLWSEISSDNIGFDCGDRQTALQTGRKWFPYNKGGDYRRWYGNNDFVVNWENDGHLLQTTMHPSGRRIWAHNFNLDYIFYPAITWTYISSAFFGVRQSPRGFLFDVGGSSAFPNENNLQMLLGFLGSNVAFLLLKILNPTLNFQAGNIGDLPVLRPELTKKAAEISNAVDVLVSISRTDWDNFESSWDFHELPLLRKDLRGSTLEASWYNWDNYCSAAMASMQELETENNRLFIEAYGLQEELSPVVPADQITLARADRRKDVVAFLSYSIGCMMGRYSLEQPGLILADAGDTVENYLKKVGKPLDQISFPPDEDAIIPVLEGEWFPDDIVARTREFLRVIFGESTLNENLRFIEESLGKSLEKYFLSDFYKDHLQTYKKRPIYWLFQSPKKGFSALVYMHRYTKDTCNTLLNGYLREYIKKLESKIAHLEHEAVAATTPRDKTKARKDAEKLRKDLKDCQEWERETLLPLAQRRLEIDLDDGVKVNYLKFGNAVATIPGLASKDDE
jgi:hypothetical protein